MAECFLYGNNSQNGLQLKVISGTERPSNTRENTIWLKTSESITNYIVSSEKPESAKAGTAWIKIEESGKEIDVGKKNPILLRLALGKMYVGEKWNNMNGYVYLSDNWVQFSKQYDSLYEDGIFGDVPHSELGEYGSITYGDSYITVKTRTSYKAQKYVQFGPMSLSNIDSIIMRAKKITASSANSNIYFAILASKLQTDGRVGADVKIEKEIGTKDVDEHSLALDVSNLTGDGWYISVGINTGGEVWNNSREVRIYEVIAE